MTPDYRRGVLDAMLAVAAVCADHANTPGPDIDGSLLLCDVMDAVLRPLGDDPLANKIRALWVWERSKLGEIERGLA